MSKNTQYTEASDEGQEELTVLRTELAGLSKAITEVESILGISDPVAKERVPIQDEQLILMVKQQIGDVIELRRRVERIAQDVARLRTQLT